MIFYNDNDVHIFGKDVMTSTYFQCVNNTTAHKTNIDCIL